MGDLREALRAAARAEVERRRTARGPDRLLDFVPFASPGFLRPEHLSPLSERLEQSRPDDGAHRRVVQRVCVSVPPRHGKALATDTPMLTSRGWVRAGDVRVGDRVCGSSGWTEVLGVFPQGVVDLFRVTMSDGSSVRASGDHRWSVRQRYGAPARVRTTRELESDLVEADARSKWRIPLPRPFPDAGVGTLPLDPYLLGAWLGDGHSRGAFITTADPEVVQAFSSVAPPIPTKHQHGGKARTYYVKGGLRRTLRMLGVLCNKHVPEVYHRAGPADRLALVQGLCDTDGTAAKDGSLQSYTTTSPALALDFRRLICGLGGKVTEYRRPAARRTSYTLQFRLPPDMQAFRLARKRDRLHPPSARNAPRRWIRSIVPDGRGEAVCFTVDAPDHLFCAGDDFVLSHNTDLFLHAVAWTLLRDPSRTFAFVSYAESFATEKCARARDLFLRVNPDGLSDRRRDHDWRTPEGGGCMAVGILGQLTGRGFTDILIDDPIKNREEAESPVHRDKVYDGFQSDLSTRLDPRGTSIYVVMARWHTDDLIGRLQRDGWETINLPALGPDGSALWPEVWSAEFLRETQRAKGPYVFGGLYQGQPVPRGTAVFGPPRRGPTPPTSEMDVAIGVDLAYSTRTRADHSAAVVVGRHRATGDLHVVEVLRRRLDAPAFSDLLASRCAMYPGAPVRWYVATTERGSVDFMRARGIPIEGAPARADKLTRSLGCSATWAAGRVVVPEGVPWADEFLSEVLAFTGTGGADDQVDALVAAHDLLVTPDADRLLPSWDQRAVARADLAAWPEVVLATWLPVGEPGGVLVCGVDAARGAAHAAEEHEAQVPGVDALMDLVADVAACHRRARRVVTTGTAEQAASMRARRVGRHLDVVAPCADADGDAAAATLLDDLVRAGRWAVDPRCHRAAREHADAAWRRGADGVARAPARTDDTVAAARRVVHPRLRRRAAP